MFEVKLSVHFLLQTVESLGPVFPFALSIFFLSTCKLCFTEKIFGYGIPCLLNKNNINPTRQKIFAYNFLSEEKISKKKWTPKSYFYLTLEVLKQIDFEKQKFGARWVWRKVTFRPGHAVYVFSGENFMATSRFLRDLLISWANHRENINNQSRE